MGTTGLSAASASWVPHKVVPARHTCEVVIKTKGCAPPQSAAEVVLKVNSVLCSGDALAARRLQSGDIVVAFKDNAEAHARDNTWVKAAFGDQAAVAKRTYAVLAKGIPRGMIEKRAEEEIKADIEKRNKATIARCRRRIPRSSDARFGLLLIEVEAVATVQQMCNIGVVLDAQIFNYKPYSGELQIIQCFNCHAYGHLAKAYTRKARCGFYGKDAHKEGDTHCPERRSNTPRCSNCGGPHTAWDRRCPAALMERQRIKDTYTYRPRQFVVGRSDISWSTAPSRSSAGALRSVYRGPVRALQPAPEAEPSDKEGFQTVAPKRKRGRPCELDRLEAGNTRIDNAFAQARSQSIAVSMQGDRGMTIAVQPAALHTNKEW